MEKINLRSEEYNSVYQRLDALHKKQADNIMALILRIKGIVRVNGVFQTELVSKMVEDLLDMAANDILEPYKDNCAELENTIAAMITAMSDNDKV